MDGHRVDGEAPADRIFSPAYYRKLARFEQGSAWNRAMARLEMDLLKSLLHPGPTHAALDVGCGAGGFLRRLAGEMPALHLYGGDPAGDAVQVAREITATPLSRLAASDLPYRDQRFDAVVINDVLQHLSRTDAERAVIEAARVLKTGGVLIVRTAARRGWGRKKHLDSDDYRQWETAELVDQMGAAGLSVRFAARVNVLPSLLADLRAFRRAAPQGDVGLGELHGDSPMKAACLSAYWALERRLLTVTRWRCPFGHTIVAAAVRGR